MKVLHIINRLGIGGAEKLIVETLPLFKEKGIDVELLVLQMPENNFEEKLLNSGVKYYSLNVKNLYSPSVIFKIRKYIKKYDIIHTHLFPVQYWVAIANVLLFNKKKILVTTEHNTDNRRRNIWCFKYLDRIIYKQYSSILAISKGTADNLAQYLGSTQKIHLISNGLNIKEYNQAKPVNRDLFGFSTTDFILIMVARFSEQKDQITVIKSLINLPFEVKLVLVGDGKLRDDCEELVRSMNLSDRVLFLGIRKDIPELLKMANVSIISSHWEGFGLVAVEGMAAGLPVIGSNVSGLSEVIGQAGLLFDKGKEKQLANHIRSLYESSELCEEVAKDCYQQSLLFDINKMIESTLEIYNKKR